RRKVLDDVPVQVFQRLGGGALPRARHPGDDHDVARRARHRGLVPLCSAHVPSPVLSPLARPGASAASTALARRGPIPGSSAISPPVAPAILRTEPKCRSSVVRRAGPSPGTESSSLTASALDRLARW